MDDKRPDPPRSARDQSGSERPGDRLGRGGGRFGKKRRKRDRRTGPDSTARLRSAREGMTGPGETDLAERILREFQAEGETWVAWEGGRASCGPPDSPSVTLVELMFARDPEGLRVERSSLSVIGSLEDLTPERLLSIWAAAGPYRNPREPGRAPDQGRQGSRRR